MKCRGEKSGKSRSNLPKFTKIGLLIRHSQAGIFFWLVFSELIWTEMDANQIWTRKIMSFWGQKLRFLAA